MANIPVTVDIKNLLDADNLIASKPALATLGAVVTGGAATGLNMSTARILGRTTATAGAVEEITVGSGLSLASGTLIATGSPISGTNNAFIFEGDSITMDTAGGAGLGWPVQLMATPTFLGKGTKYNFANSSSKVSSTNNSMAYRYADSVKPQRPGLNSQRPAYLFVLCGTNDIGGTDASAIIAALETYWSTAKGDGFTVVAMTVMPANFDILEEVKRQAVNDGIRRSTTWDYLIDASSVLPNKYDASVYGDGLHPTAAGNRIIAREAEAVFITRRKAPMPDTTATRATPKLVVGGNAGSKTETLVVLDQTIASGQNSTSGNLISSSVVWPLDVSFSHSALNLGVSQTGSFGCQYLYGVNTGVSLSTVKSITEGAAFVGTMNTSDGSRMYSGVSFLASRPFASVAGGGGRPYTMDRATGLKVDLQKQPGVDTGVGIDVVGATDVNFIVGKLRLGSTTTPANTLDITGTVKLTSYIEGSKEAEPLAPLTNGYRIFAVDNGSGKTVLKVRFATGASQVLATEP